MTAAWTKEAVVDWWEVIGLRVYFEGEAKKLTGEQNMKDEQEVRIKDDS